jgi:hypothetical protein
MANHPTFNLTRSPICQWHLDFFAERLRGDCLGSSPDLFLVSGDYEAATDNLNPDLSEFCLKAIADRVGIDPWDARVLLLGLTGHVIHRVRDDVGVPQEWGQLMGSPISFPILCLINAAVTRLAMEMGGWFGPWDGSGTPKRPLTDYPILINGDDVGFQANSAIYGIWKWVTQAAGLKFSLGKNYTHKGFLILNSQLFEVVPQVDFFGQVTTRLWRAHHLEVGLLYGQVKGQSRAEGEESLYTSSPHLDSARSLAQMGRDLIGPWSNGQRSWLLSKLISVNRSKLDRVPRGMSWFLPRQLGGLGLPSVPDHCVSVTPQQLRLASFLATRPVDDPTLRDLLVPDLPSYLMFYMNRMSEVGGELGARGYQTHSPNDSFLQKLKDEKSFFGLWGWCSRGGAR